MVCDLVTDCTGLLVDLSDESCTEGQVCEPCHTADFGDDRLGERVECNQCLAFGNVLVLLDVENRSALGVLSVLGTENRDLVTEDPDRTALDGTDHVLASVGADYGVSGNSYTVGDALGKLHALGQGELVQSRSVEDVALSCEEIISLGVLDDVAGDSGDQNRVLELDLVVLCARGCGSSDVEGSHRELCTGLTD